MPFIHVKTNCAIGEEKELILKEKFGTAIAILPGKSEQWLMLEFSEKCRMYFRGENQCPMALVEVKIYGRADTQAYQALTAEISQILFDTLAIEKNQIYVKYEEVSHWGLNGTNF